MHQSFSYLLATEKNTEKLTPYIVYSLSSFSALMSTLIITENNPKLLGISIS